MAWDRTSEGPRFLCLPPLFFSSFRMLFLYFSHYYPRTSTCAWCAMHRTTSTNDPLTFMNTVPYRTIPFVCCHVKLTLARSIQHDAMPHLRISLLFVVQCLQKSWHHSCFLFLLFIIGLLRGVRSYDDAVAKQRSRPIQPKLAGSAPSPCPSVMEPAIAVRGGIFIFGSGTARQS